MNRKILKSLLLASVASLGLIGSTLAVSAETLADALVSAYRNSHLLEQNRAALRAADEDVAQAVADLRPVLQWTANYGYTKNDATVATYKAAGKTYQALLLRSVPSQYSIWMDQGPAHVPLRIAGAVGFAKTVMTMVEHQP